MLNIIRPAIFRRRTRYLDRRRGMPAAGKLVLFALSAALAAAAALILGESP